MKRYVDKRIMIVSVVLMAVFGSAFINPSKDISYVLGKASLETKEGHYSLQVFRNQVLIQKDGKPGTQSWELAEGLRIADFLVARRLMDADDELLLIIGPEDSEYGNRFDILGVTPEGTLKPRASESMREMNPWQLQAADIDGDGVLDISITMYKKTKFHPVMANRPFLYSWKTDRIEPLWRGSRLSRPFEAYVFSDLDNDGRDELIATEQLQNGGRVLQAYGWKGFGFEGIAQSIPCAEIRDLQVDSETGSVEAWVIIGNGKGLHTAIYEDGQIKLVKVK